MRFRTRLASAGAATLGLSLLVGVPAVGPASAQVTPPTTQTPIQHLVVIFQENESFDHYFATYPYATNAAGEDQFTVAANTPTVDGLCTGGPNPTVASAPCTASNVGTSTLMTANPNGVEPQRFDPGANANGVYNANLDTHGSNAGIDSILTCSQNHNYTPEQTAFDGGAMDKFPANVGSTAAAPEPGEPACTTAQNLDYYDGNTVTGYWNYAQHYAMSDNNYDTDFGPSTPGALDVVSGDTNGVNVATPSLTSDAPASGAGPLVSDGAGGYTDINDGDPYYDDCSSTSKNFGLSGQNVGDLLNKAGLSWGFFEGGFNPTSAYSGPANGPSNPYTQTSVTGRAVCGASHNIGAQLGGTGSTGAQPYGVETDYIQHHEPFQYYATTANPHHILPTSLSAIGTDTQTFSGGSYGVGTPEFNTANHQYDVSEFNQLVSAIAQNQLPASDLPAVSYLKAPAYEDEHPSYSDPIDGQHFVTQEINSLMQTPDWSSTAVIVTYDDSDGWYDHVWSGAQNGNQPQNPSHVTGADTLTGTGACGTSTSPLGGVNGRCGLGPRLPFLVISPYAKANFVDHTMIDQASVVNFIEYNWGLGSIQSSADTLFNANGSGKYDISNLFDFTPGAADTAGATPFYLDPGTFQPTTIPTPLLPDSHTPVLFIVSGSVLLGGAFLLVGRRQVRRRRAPRSA
jgi:phospholipase C